MKREIRIPTLLGLLTLLLGVAGSVWLISSKQLLFLKANSSEQPSYISLTNTTDTSFTVSWITDKPVSGTVIYGTDLNNLSQAAADDRDQESSKVSPYSTHHVTVGKFRPLTPSSTYYFIIQSGGTVYDSQGKPYQTKTAPAIIGQAPTLSDTVSGKVVNSDGAPAVGTIVYLSLPNVAPQSTLTTASGNWVIPLTLARSSDLSGLATYDKVAGAAEFFVQGDTGEKTANASASLSNARPTPTITLGQTYNWIASQSGESPSPQPTSSPTSRGSFALEPLAPPSVSTREVTIVSPSSGESVNTSRPAIVGTGPKGTRLSITVESPGKLSGSATVAADGTWTWSVPTDLPAGQHTLTITYTNPLGELRRLTKKFTVLAAESSLPAFVATPSGSIAPTPTPTPTSTPRATSTPSPTPTPSPTTSPRVSLPSTESGVPVSGVSTPTLGLIIFGLIFLLAGFAPLLIQKRSFR